jgi:D-alanyl-D-alanine carboxypeptidase
MKNKKYLFLGLSIIFLLVVVILGLLQKVLVTDREIYKEQIILDSPKNEEQKISSSFSQDAKKAIILFQKENNLPQTGIFDQATNNKLNSIFYDELCPVQIVEYPDYTDFIFSKADESNKLPDDFIPKDLKNIKDDNIKNAGSLICLRSDALASLKNMFDDAKKNGISLAVTSGFRNREVQEWLVNYYVSNFGVEQLNGVALPGYSEHQLGTTVDLTGSSIGYQGADSDFKNTVEYKWLQKNASQYGFFLSYPIGNPDYKFEPWHWRFWGTKED